jgi:hypothetical protein
MHEAVKNLGANFRGQFRGQSYRNFPLLSNSEEPGEHDISVEEIGGKVGGGEWSRTTDAADMSRVL